MDEALLDINGAARFLGVSASSLRRWTNSGRLACLRVGGRRERRFRVADLVAFLQEQPAQSHEAALPPAADYVSIGGTALPYGTHLCGFYSTDEGRARLAVAFLAGGIDSESVCYLIAEPAAQRAILPQLSSDPTALQRDIAGGRLVVYEYAATVRAQHDYWETHFVAAIAGGARTIRVVGDMVGLAEGITREELVEYERGYDEILSRRFPVVTLCLYDVRRFSSLDILAALRGHRDGFRYPAGRWLA
jgi:transcriptional repressor of dcmA and dcmR